MNQPMTVCISFPLRGQESGFPSCCSSLWPPEGGVQVSHSGAAVLSAQMCSGEERVEPGWMLKSWTRGRVMEMQRSHTLQPN